MGLLCRTFPLCNNDRTNMAKAMKAMKAMKALKKKIVSKVARSKCAKLTVFNGTKERTVGGLRKADLLQNKRGKIVSKKQSLLAKKRFAQTIGPWIQAIKKARAALKIKGFFACKKGSPLYIKAKELLKQN